MRVIHDVSGLLEEGGCHLLRWEQSGMIGARQVDAKASYQELGRGMLGQLGSTRDRCTGRLWNLTADQRAIEI